MKVLAKVVGAAILAVIVWYFGPLLGIGALHPLDSELVRDIVVAVIFIGWLIENLIHRRQVSLWSGLSHGRSEPCQENDQTHRKKCLRFENIAHFPSLSSPLNPALHFPAFPGPPTGKILGSRCSTGGNAGKAACGSIWYQ